MKDKQQLIITWIFDNGSDTVILTGPYDVYSNKDGGG